MSASLPARFPRHIVIDTCVLMSNILRHLLLRMAQAGHFQPVWAEYIGVEWRRNASRIWNVAPEILDTEWQALQQQFPLANMGNVAAFEEGLKRSDKKDWHVIAAARAVQQKHPESTVCILTRNIKDFHRAEIRNLGLYLYDPDQFLVMCWEHHQPCMQTLFELIPKDALKIGRPAEPLETVFKRERLFRLNKLVQQEQKLQLDPAI
ncbi:MAG: PIN domain-containing protein [Advenella sp.]|nr:PIN domain-containing protein [Advenella sp.]